MKPDSHHHMAKRLLRRGWQLAGPCIRRYVLKNRQTEAEALEGGRRIWKPALGTESPPQWPGSTRAKPTTETQRHGGRLFLRLMAVSQQLLR